MIIFFELMLLTIASANPLVSTRLGQLLGQWRTSAGGRTYASFEGVPYAVPPVGQYRFVETIEVRPWLGVWNATKTASLCLQYEALAKNVTGQEDCLFLNIYSPKLSSSALMPVIVFLHGGAYMFGSGSMYGAERLMDCDLVVVTINYRLGPFGFLSTGDNVVPGNAGLKDQNLALRWVKQHIQQFGGNPNNIILYGNSAGSASVNYHLLSSRSYGLFHRAIMSSGSALAPWSLQIRPEEKARRLAELVGCPCASNQEMVNCLRSRPAQMILNAEIDMLGWREALFTPFEPVVEPPYTNAFVVRHPYDSMAKGLFTRVPLLIGFTSQEGLYPAALYQSDPTILPEIEEKWPEIASHIFNYNFTIPESRRDEVALKIKEFYFNNRPISQETYMDLVKALGDRNFYVDIGKFTRMYTLRSTENVFMYQYSFRGERSLTESAGKTEKDFGVSHTDDLFRIFKVPDYELKREDDLKIIKVLVNIICSFATNGQPALPNNALQWPPVSPGNINGINILSPSNFDTFQYENFGNKSFWDSLGFYENEQRYAVRNNYFSVNVEEIFV